MTVSTSDNSNTPQNTTKKSLSPNPVNLMTDEDTDNLYDFIRNVVMIRGIDWDQLEEEEQIEFAQSVLIDLGQYINNYIDQIADEDDKKHLRMIIASGINDKLIARYPEIETILQGAMEAYIENLTQENPENQTTLNKDDNTDDKDDVEENNTKKD
jgi:hypothetical protein